MVAALLGLLRRPVARVTTLGCFLEEEALEVAPHYDGFLETMQRCRDAGGRYAALELTSEALALGFAKAWPCRVGVFTNLSLDHSDAHGSPEHYLASKAQLFLGLPSDGCAVLNACDENAQLLNEVIPAGTERLHYGVASRGAAWAPLDLSADSIEPSLEGTRALLAPSRRFAGLPRQLELRAIGEVFVENALAALAAALWLGAPADAACRALASLPPPPGRFQVVRREPVVVVDYAHTPDALQRTLETARALCRGRLSLVLGAGGDRDPLKRPLLGAAAAAADRVLLTSDNPRSEQPEAIMDAIGYGIPAGPEVLREVDRKRAIELALTGAAAGDWVLIAGKGHEQTQEAHGERVRFSDQEIVEQAKC
jgi:UDP-N-acetylmuramoyl-L-alanyl-D-glutamate--2,6-diaminopimelate ligase